MHEDVVRRKQGACTCNFQRASTVNKLFSSTRWKYRRPLTWETLITALQAAKLHEKATICWGKYIQQRLHDSTVQISKFIINIVMVHLLVPTGSQPGDEDCIVMMKTVNEQLGREVQWLKEEKEKWRKEQQNAVTYYDHPPRDNPPQIMGILQPRSHDPTYPQSHILQPLPTPGAGEHYVPQIWTAGDSYSQESLHAPTPYHATYTNQTIATWRGLTSHNSKSFDWREHTTI